MNSLLQIALIVGVIIRSVRIGGSLIGSFLSRISRSGFVGRLFLVIVVQRVQSNQTSNTSGGGSCSYNCGRTESGGTKTCGTESAETESAETECTSTNNRNGKKCGTRTESGSTYNRNSDKSGTRTEYGGFCRVTCNSERSICYKENNRGRYSGCTESGGTSTESTNPEKTCVNRVSDYLMYHRRNRDEFHTLCGNPLIRRNSYPPICGSTRNCTAESNTNWNTE